jgi:probable LLM family oxidoreductase
LFEVGSKKEKTMELGIFSFVENTVNDAGIKRSPTQRIQDLLEEVKLADELGLDVYGIGEHHREEFVASNPATLLAAAAAITKNIKLTSTVTVLGSDDPVRIYQQFSSLDLISKGRAEITVGRGSFIESFPLFGYDLADYESVFEEKLGLLLKINENERLNWEGKHRPSINNLPVYPRAHQQKLPIWRAVGGTPKSAYITGALGLPMALAIIGGYPKQFTQMAEIHKQGAKESDQAVPKLSINSHGLITEDSKSAREIAFPSFKRMMDKIGSERGWPPMSRAQFDASTEIEGANFIGSPQEIIDKIMYQYEIFGHDRFLMQMSVGSVPHDAMLKSIELFATKVAPVIREATKKTASASS